MIVYENISVRKYLRKKTALSGKIILSEESLSNISDSDYSLWQREERKNNYW